MVKTIKSIQNLPDGRKSVSLYNSFAKTDFIRLFARGFFMSRRLFIVQNIGLLYSNGCSLQKCLSVLANCGGNSLSSFFKSQISFMPKPMKLENGRIICTPQSTSGSTKTAIIAFVIISVFISSCCAVVVPTSKLTLFQIWR